MKMSPLCRHANQSIHSTAHFRGYTTVRYGNGRWWLQEQYIHRVDLETTTRKRPLNSFILDHVSTKASRFSLPEVIKPSTIISVVVYGFGMTRKQDSCLEVISSL